MGIRNFFGVTAMGVLAAATLTANTSFAHPAPPGLQTATQPDGSELKIFQFGDEHYHYATTEDSILVVQDSTGTWYYADESGKASAHKAKNASKRSAKENAFVKGINQENARKQHGALFGGRFPDVQSSLNFTHTPTYRYSAYSDVPAPRLRPRPMSWVKGERYFPVLLVSSPDKAAVDSTRMYRLMNEEGYSEEGNVGSVRDYFLATSMGQFSPHFDIYPVTLDKRLSDYVTNGNFSEGGMTSDGLKKLVARSDFMANASKYCLSGKAVDGFIFLFPGMEEDALKLSEEFWGHKYSMRYNGSTRQNCSWNGCTYNPYSTGGYTFDDYLFIAQLEDKSSGKRLNQVGIFVHEFSHVMGLSDHYVGSTGAGGPTPYDVMTQGMYNYCGQIYGWSTNGLLMGRCPPTYSAFEREAMGWMTLDELEFADDVFVLPSIHHNKAYSVTNPNKSDEYYIVEYRPKVGPYDSHIADNGGGNGVFVWYIDYDRDVFELENDPNGDANHQRVAIKRVVLSGENRQYSSYDQFEYVNAGGKARIGGVYNFVKPDTSRVCFTMDFEKSVKECPELVESSGSAEPPSSSAMAPASSAAVITSSAAAWLSSSAGGGGACIGENCGACVGENCGACEGPYCVDPVNSSGSVKILAETPREAAYGVALEQGRLKVTADVVGNKSVALLDMQGRILKKFEFDGSLAEFDLNQVVKGAFVVRITAGGRVLGQKMISLK